MPPISAPPSLSTAEAPLPDGGLVALLGSTLPAAPADPRPTKMLLGEAEEALRARGATQEHLEAFAQIFGQPLKSPRKSLVQLTRALAALGEIPEQEPFTRICRQLQNRLHHQPDIGWRELYTLAAGLRDFFAAGPTSALAAAVEEFLPSASQRGFALAHLMPLVTALPRLERAELVSTTSLTQLLDRFIATAPTKYPATLPELLSRALTREVLAALVHSPLSDQGCATFQQLCPFHAIHPVLSALRSHRAHAGALTPAARASAELLFALCSGEALLSPGSRASYDSPLRYWDGSLQRALEQLAALTEKATKDVAAQRTLADLAAGLAPGVTPIRLAEQLAQHTDDADFDSWLTREATLSESGVTALQPLRVPFGSPSLSAAADTLRKEPDQLRTLHHVVDLARGYDALRLELSPGLGSGLLPSLLEQFGRSCARQTIPVVPPIRRAFPGHGVVVSGINADLLYPLQHGLMGDLGHSVEETVRALGSARRDFDQTTFLVCEGLLAVMGREGTRYTLGSRHYSLLIVPPGPHSLTHPAGWLVPTELLTTEILRPAKEGLAPRIGRLHPRLLAPSVDDAIPFSDHATFTHNPMTQEWRLAAHYQRLFDLFRLRLSLWHKGQDLDSGRAAFFSAASTRMLQECYRLHHLGQSLGAPSNAFPTLIAASTFSYRGASHSPFRLSTHELTLSVDGVSYSLPRSSDGHGPSEFALWHRHVVPYLRHVGTDLRFVI